MTLAETKNRGSFMDLSTLKEMFPLFLTGMVTLGGSVAWVLNRMDAKNINEREFEQNERNKLEKFFTDQIATLQSEIHNQNIEIIQLRRELNTYVRHVGVLEGLLHANKIDFPKLDMFEIVGK